MDNVIFNLNIHFKCSFSFVLCDGLRPVSTTSVEKSILCSFIDLRLKGAQKNQKNKQKMLFSTLVVETDVNFTVKQMMIGDLGKLSFAK